MEKIYKLVISGVRGGKKEISLCDTEEEFKRLTVKHLKEKIVQHFPEYSGEENLRHIFIDRILDEDYNLLCDYGIQHMSVIHVVLSLPGGGSGEPPVGGNSGMGDKDGKNRSMERLCDFKTVFKKK